MRERTSIGRLANACAALNLGPSFDEVQREQLVASARVKAKDAERMVNADLKALAVSIGFQS